MVCGVLQYCCIGFGFNLDERAMIVYSLNVMRMQV